MTEQRTELSRQLVVEHKHDGRKCYDEQAKRELVEASLRPGVSVARMVLEHGINANLLGSPTNLRLRHVTVDLLEEPDDDALCRVSKVRRGGDDLEHVRNRALRRPSLCTSVARKPLAEGVIDVLDERNLEWVLDVAGLVVRHLQRVGHALETRRAKQLPIESHVHIAQIESAARVRDSAAE